MNKSTSGFTIVELLIVIVVIAILAVITIVAFNGVKSRAQTSEIAQELNSLKRAIMAAKTSTGTTLYRITGTTWTGGPCFWLPSGTNVATLVGTNDDCWTRYVSSINAINAAGGSKLNPYNLLDPWGRPYYIDENEETAGCTQDKLAALSNPYIASSEANTIGNVLIPLTWC